jgi:hypothetical protein
MTGISRGNGTPAAVLAELADNATDSRWYYNMNQTRIGVEGSAFELPGAGCGWPRAGSSCTTA